jgi:transposase
MAAIEAAILEQIRADPDLAQRLAILTTIPGVSAITAFALLIEMPELGALEAGQAASLAGLAPAARQSGRWTGRAVIRGGRAAIRQAICMPALVATRFNPDLEAKYNQLTNAGKPAKVALTAVMRKLIVLANTLLKANRRWILIPIDQNGYSSARTQGPCIFVRSRFEPLAASLQDPAPVDPLSGVARRPVPHP